MSMTDGIVNSAVDAENLITVPLVNKDAYFRGVYVAWQGAVDASDGVKTQRASLEVTKDGMAAINQALSDLGMNTSAWTAKSGADAVELTLSLALTGIAPPVNGSGFEIQGTGNDVAFIYQSNGVEQLYASFWYQRGGNWVQGSAIPPASVGGNIPASSALVMSDTDGKWRYWDNSTLREIRPYPPDTFKSAHAFNDMNDIPGAALPGNFLKNTDTGKYYILSVDNKLIEVPSPDSATFFPCYRTADASTLDSWRKELATSMDHLARTSQVQIAYLQELSNRLQNLLSLLTNMLQRFERNASSVIDRTG